MKKLSTFLLAIALIFAFAVTPLSIKVNAYGKITTPATGFTKASDVDYQHSGKYVYNWGARNETCNFLTTYAQKYYTSDISFNNLSKYKGGTAQSNVHKSELYNKLSSTMSSRHKYFTGYRETNDYYRYTDCVRNDKNYLSTFYTGAKKKSSYLDGWNKEHTWPKSKTSSGKESNQAHDLMMLHPALSSENSKRGNTAYGESSNFEDPGLSTRGDCARVFLYVYTRWRDYNFAWGASGVMENMTVLLKWMEEDPVDTWEMGRNDAVQQITGVRNIFVDYPEYAWLMFGKNIPKNMSTPSGIANDGNPVVPNPDSSESSDVTPEPNPDPEPEVPTQNIEYIKTAPVAGTAYKMAFFHENSNKTMLLTGEMDENKQYKLAITDNPTLANDFFVEKTGDKYYLYVVLNGEKVYLGINEENVNGHIKGSITRSSQPQIALSYYETVDGIELNTLANPLNGNKYFLGCHGANNYVTAHDINYLIKNPGAVTYIARFGTLSEIVNPNPEPNPNPDSSSDSSEIEPEPNPDPDYPTPDSSNEINSSNGITDDTLNKPNGCQASLSGSIISIIALSASVILFRKRK